jgi:cyclophilin family peptidyl-prolyl cis-trans isomerase
MPSADKRARKKENARAAREQREAAVRRKKRLRSSVTVGVIVAIFVGLVVILSISSGGGKKKDKATTSATTPKTAATTPKTPSTPVTTAKTFKVAAQDETIDPSKTYTATISTNFGNIGLSLDTKNAPIGAAHFITLARAGVYDGSRWHRIIKDFVIQGGAPGGDISKSYGRSVVGEVPKGKYVLGALAAAKTPADPAGTFDSQFYIVIGPQGEALPPLYADFGTVTSGMDVVQKIGALATDANGEPSQAATIDKITITES